ncbi:MAG: hypothetical protein PHI35_00385 [Victivallaceae bacterium]|nr:hypothetical protein [Victivallaceae bacterium]
MNSINSIVHTALLFLFLAAITGCESLPPPAPPPSEGLSALRAAVRCRMLDVRTIELLGSLASEQGGNKLALELTGVINDAERDGVDFTRVSNTLDQAVAYNFLLSRPDNLDLAKLLRPRIAQLLDCETASLAAKAAAATGGDKQKRELELRVLAGLTVTVKPEDLPEPFDLTAPRLALLHTALKNRPETGDAEPDSGLIEKVRVRIGGGDLVGLYFAEMLFSMPRRVELSAIRYPNSDWESAADLANAVAVAFQLEADLAKLSAAKQAWDRHPDPATRLDWQLAYFKLLADMGGVDAPPTGKNAPFDFTPDPIFNERLLELIGERAIR